MIIAYCLHSFHRPGGIERVISLKANYLADKAGHDVYLIVARQKGRVPAFPLSGRIHLIDLDINDNLFPSKFSNRLDIALKSIKADICIATGDNCTKALISCSHDCKKIAEFHFSHEKYYMKYGHKPFGKAYAAYRTRKIEHLAAKLDHFVVLTESDKKDWAKSLNNVRCIYNPKTFTSDESANLDRKRCIAVGRLERQKNFNDAIVAWQKVAQTHPEWTLDIYGSGSLEQKLKAQISRLGLEGKVRLMGLSKEIHKEMQDSSMLIMTSKYEGFPMVLLEASECGLPMVSYDCPKGPAEIIKEGCNGFLIAPGDTQALADAICRLIEDRQLLISMGQNSREGAKQFNIDSIMQQWQLLFES